MKTISVHKFCLTYDVPQSFIDSLYSFELIELIEIKTAKHILIEDINRIERLMRMHYELNVNFEGLDIINNLVNQIKDLQEDVNILRNRIEFYK
jgi:signal transduction histidine kinase